MMLNPLTMPKLVSVVCSFGIALGVTTACTSLTEVDWSRIPPAGGTGGGGSAAQSAGADDEDDAGGSPSGGSAASGGAGGSGAMGGSTAGTDAGP